MILLSAGHTPEAPGACAGSFCEHAEAMEWVKRIAWQLRHDMEVQVIPSAPLAIYKRDANGKTVKDENGRPIVIGGKVLEINDAHARRPAHLAVEIHFNSAPGHAGKGSETLYCPGSVKGKRAADIVQRRLGATMLPDRGVKEGWYRMDRPDHVDYVGDVDGDEKIDYFLKATDPIALIVEPEFIHNRQMIHAYRDLACVEIAFGINLAAAAIARD